MKIAPNYKNFTLYLALITLTVSASTAVQAIQGPVIGNSQNAHEAGQAFFFQEADNCYTLMPTHVLQELNNKPIVVRTYGGQNYYTQAQQATDLGDDVSLVPVTGLPLRACGSPRGIMRHNIDSLLKQSSTATLKGIDVNNGTMQQTVDIIDIGNNHLQIKPLLNDMSFYKGQSGSLVFANNEPIGMLMSIHARHGTGAVLRQNILLEKVADHFKQERLLDLASPNTANTSSFIASLESTAQPIDAQHTVHNLFDEDSAHHWQVSNTSGAAQLKVSLNQQQEITGLVFDATGLDLELLPQSVEIKIDIGGNGAWRSLKYEALNFIDGKAQMQFAPRLAKQIKFLFYAQQKNGPLALQHLQIITLNPDQ